MSPLRSNNMFYLIVLSLHAHIFTIYHCTCPPLSLFLLFVLMSVLEYLVLATTTHFFFPFAWNIFTNSFSFSLCVPLMVKWVSYRQHKVVIDNKDILLTLGEFLPVVLCILHCLLPLFDHLCGSVHFCTDKVFFCSLSPLFWSSVVEYWVSARLHGAVVTILSLLL